MKVTCIVNIAYLCKSWGKEKVITEIEGRGTYSSGFTCVFPGMKENRGGSTDAYSTNIRTVPVHDPWTMDHGCHGLNKQRSFFKDNVALLVTTNDTVCNIWSEMLVYVSYLYSRSNS